MITTFTALFKTAAAVTLISGGAALANGNPPVVTPPPFQGRGDASSNSDALAQALAAAFAGAVSGSSSSAAQQQAQGQSQSSRNNNQSAATGGAGGNASASGGNQAISIDNSNRQRMAANTAAMVIPGGYGPANCYGDTNPSGSFGASMQVFGWGVAANSQKASNVCAVAALAGPAAAIGYLQRMDPNMPRSVVTTQPTGRLICPPTHPTLTEKGCK